MDLTNSVLSFLLGASVAAVLVLPGVLAAAFREIRRVQREAEGKVEDG